MERRISKQDLELQIEVLNSYFGIHKWDHKTAGHFYVEFAYGGCRLVRVINEGGGETNMSIRRGTKREIYLELYAINNVLQQIDNRPFSKMTLR